MGRPRDDFYTRLINRAKAAGKGVTVKVTTFPSSWGKLSFYQKGHRLRGALHRRGRIDAEIYIVNVWQNTERVRLTYGGKVKRKAKR